MSFTGIHGLDHSINSTNEWIAAVASAFETEDRDFAYRVLRAWMHSMRDRLTVEAAAHLAAQLPELLRGVFYDGWSPRHMPYKYDAQRFAERFADEARVARTDVHRTASTVTEVVMSRIAPGGVEQALRQMPDELRRLVSEKEVSRR
ncbi:DUF2267 domain-containing protein [Actinomadura viridis]|uniref:Uncharacterized protein (DUF2267 family) n=1 Tax=Actinomadura viridis TaxID=58110 RepID=A0A931DU72_9ACTN|nr:DUF2267 domain-containing protein [Actinomadura viridis]MBG6093941.1 uncharacterized protein (DUF2267 family) [Actinomadura viridis]